MNEKLIIKDFKNIKNLEIDLNNINVLIWINTFKNNILYIIFLFRYYILLKSSLKYNDKEIFWIIDKLWEEKFSWWCIKNFNYNFEYVFLDNNSKILWSINFSVKNNWNFEIKLSKDFDSFIKDKYKNQLIFTNISSEIWLKTNTNTNINFFLENKDKIVPYLKTLVEKYNFNLFNRLFDIAITNEDKLEEWELLILQIAIILFNIENNKLNKENINIIYKNIDNDLHPEYQYEVIKLLVLIRNKMLNKWNLNIYFTTNSPYILTTLNNLITLNEINKKQKIKTNSKISNIDTIFAIEFDNITAIDVFEWNKIIDLKLEDEFWKIIIADWIDNISNKIWNEFNNLLSKIK